MESAVVYENACLEATVVEDLNKESKTLLKPSPFLDNYVIRDNLNKLYTDNNVITIPENTKVLDYIENNRTTLNNNSPFHVMDLRTIEQRHAKWRHYLPRVDTFYAMKCNNDLMLIKTLFAHGSGFDCASKREIEIALEIGCDPSRIIFANPCKLPSDIEYACSVGVQLMTFDNEDELDKMKAAFDKVNNGLECKPVIRIVTDDSHSVCKFSQKFGANLDDCSHLLNYAKSINVNIVGVSFHVGSGCASTYSYTKAVRDARHVFDLGLGIGHPMYFLDLGGGWPGDDNGHITFPSISEAICPILDELFPYTTGPYERNGIVCPQIQIIAEPGRYFSHATMYFSTPIIARRTNNKLPSWELKNGEANQQPHVLYYIGDGCYGAFNCILYDHYTPERPMSFINNNDEKQLIIKEQYNLLNNDNNEEHEILPGWVRAKVFGPTCDGIDCIFQEITLPLLEIGDWLVFHNMGAYTVAAQSSFNGIPRPAVIYTRSSIENHDYSFINQNTNDNVEEPILPIETGSPVVEVETNFHSFTLESP